MASPHSFCCSSRAEGVGWWSRLVPPSMDWAATALLCAAAATVITLVHIYHHLLHYAEPIYQRFIVRLIFMAPVMLRSASA
ncbi:hypothetical protein E2562_026796 [Oryza meyeriana var. granulata]|uniref:Uncharacterized protein n=1 Tax=Oryza meyeriana var. granulata TaxID=110450 RepID=A0A6G1CIU2_9ORYZ|nr:hypothetical protein E2562_026796 [Oryza meyeriana var. granulata]